MNINPNYTDGMETILLEESLPKKTRRSDTSAIKINNYINPTEATSDSTPPIKQLPLELQNTPRVNSSAYFSSGKNLSIAQLRTEARNEINRPNTPPLHEILQRCHLSNEDITNLDSTSNRSTPSTSYLSSPSPKLDLPPLHPPSPLTSGRNTRTPTPTSSLFLQSYTNPMTSSPPPLKINNSPSPTKPFLPKLDLSKVNK